MARVLYRGCGPAPRRGGCARWPPRRSLRRCFSCVRGRRVQRVVRERAPLWVFPWRRRRRGVGAAEETGFSCALLSPPSGSPCPRCAQPLAAGGLPPGCSVKAAGLLSRCCPTVPVGRAVDAAVAANTFALAPTGTRDVARAHAMLRFARRRSTPVGRLFDGPHCSLLGLGVKGCRCPERALACTLDSLCLLACSFRTRECVLAGNVLKFEARSERVCW